MHLFVVVTLERTNRPLQDLTGLLMSVVSHTPGSVNQFVSPEGPVVDVPASDEDRCGSALSLAVGKHQHWCRSDRWVDTKQTYLSPVDTVFAVRTLKGMSEKPEKISSRLSGSKCGIPQVWSPMVQSQRVVGGAEATYGSHPWLVSGLPFFFEHFFTHYFAEWPTAAVQSLYSDLQCILCGSGFFVCSALMASLLMQANHYFFSPPCWHLLFPVHQRERRKVLMNYLQYWIIPVSSSDLLSTVICTQYSK